MKIVTVLLNGLTVAAAATDGAGHAKVDLNSLTVDDALISVQVTSDTTVAPGTGKQIDVYYAFSNNSISTLTDAPTQLANSATKFTVTLENIANVTREFQSANIKLKARYIYAWYSCRGLNAAVTMTASVIT